MCIEGQISKEPIFKKSNCPTKSKITFFVFLELVLIAVILNFGYGIISFEKYNTIQTYIGLLFLSVLFCFILLLYLKITDFMYDRKKAIKFAEKESKMTIRELVKEGKKKYPQYK